MNTRRAFIFALALAAAASAQVEVSGVYPHLAMYNRHGECGTGAVVPFAGRLWVITYAPHEPRGSTDKLYEITPDLRQIVRGESIGGTPANRLIHRETDQLVIGPYVVDSRRRVRAIPYHRMIGRLTGTARHLTDPVHKVYFATMEEGFYEVDLRTLEVTRLYADTQVEGDHPRADLPGYHGKGLYSGQGRLVYANNGESSEQARRRPDVPSGALAEWDGESWRVVRRNQFTEVTGPGGIGGNLAPATDPVWSIGWDHRSLILMVLDGGRWHSYRLPKGSHSYDGAHGWNTEWPRIREIGTGDQLLMTMHGTFWHFPATFTATSSRGIAPRSNYLKVVGDFCRWNDRVVLGCDDTARNEFLNRRRAKGELAGPGQSHSNLWFVEPGQLDALGPAIGRGTVWSSEDVAADTRSDPFLFDGYDARGVHLMHSAEVPVRFMFEIDEEGDGTFHELRDVEVPAHGHVWTRFGDDERGAWVRLAIDRDAPGVTAAFHYANTDRRSTTSEGVFDGLATVDDEEMTGAVLRVRGDDRGTLAVCAVNGEGYYELDGELKLRRVDDQATRKRIARSVAIPEPALTIEPASVLYVDDDGNRWRLPKSDPAFDRNGPLGPARLDREVATERDLFHAHGTFYELPARNAGGFAKLRPIATHRFRIHDYASFRGLLVMTGLTADADGPGHVVRSDDGELALWTGVIDDLWKLGKPRGEGGPWLDTPARPGEPSDPYLMTGYDQKAFELSHDAEHAVAFEIQVDVTGDGTWGTWQRIDVASGATVAGSFPDGFDAYWVRVVANAACGATAQFSYR